MTLIKELDENLQRQFFQVRSRTSPIICQKLKFIYFFVPKCACTSLKYWIYQIEFDREFKAYKKDNKRIDIHHCGELNTLALHELPEKKQDYKIITLIRDPIKRFISAYSNRIVFHKELSRQVAYRDKIETANLKFNPNINYFVENLELYQNIAPTIWHHTRPITHFIGQDLSLYTHIYRIEDINRIKEDLLSDSNLCLTTHGIPEIPKLPSGGPKLKLNVLKPENFDKLCAYYDEDYRVLQEYYSLEKIKEQYYKEQEQKIVLSNQNLETAKAKLNQGNELKEQVMLTELIESYQKAIALKPENPLRVDKELGDALYQNGNIEEAIAAYQKAIAILPSNSILHAKLARAMMAQKNIQGAIAAYQKAIALQPEQPAWVYHGMGDAFNHNGEIEEAISAYQKAIEIKPDNSRLHAKLARAMMAQKNIQGAIANYQKAVALQPEQPAWIYQGMGDAFNHNGQIEEAIAAYQKAIEIKPDNSIAHTKLAEAMMAQKNIQGAITSYQKAIQLKPDNPSIYYNLSQLYLQKNRLNNAIDTYYKALKLKPGLEWSKRYFRLYIRLRYVLELQGREDEVTRIESSYLEFTLICLELTLERGKQLQKINKLDEAINTYRSFIDANPQLALNPKLASCYTLLGEALYEKGQIEEAELSFRLGISLLGNLSQDESLESLVRKVSVNNTVIITAVNNLYFPLFQTWYSYFKKHSVYNLLVIALDPIVYGKLKELKIPTFLRNVSSYQKQVTRIIFVEKVKVLHQINKMNINYLWTDVDSIWLQNPLKLLEKFTADIVSSIAYALPAYISRDWGFILNTGFHAVKSNKNTKKMFEKYLEYAMTVENDQISLNQLLFDNNISWKKNDDNSYQGQCDQLNLKVWAIPDNLITRSTKFANESYVFQPGGPLKEKFTQLSKLKIRDCY